MSRYTFDSQDYQFIHQVLLTYHQDTKEVDKAMLFLLKDDNMDYKSLMDSLSKQNYAQLPVKKMTGLKDFSTWPFPDNLDIQKNLYHYFINKKLNLADVFKDISCMTHLSTIEMENNAAIKKINPLLKVKKKFATGYAQGLIENIYKDPGEDKKWCLVDFMELNKLPVLKLIEKYDWQDKERLYEKLEKILKNRLNLEDKDFENIFSKLGDIPEKYNNLKKAIKYQESSLLIQDSWGTKFLIDLEKIAQETKIKLATIANSIEKLITFYKKNKSFDFNYTLSEMEIKITVNCANFEDKQTIRAEFPEIVEIMKNKGFPLEEDIEKIVEANRFKKSLEKNIQEKHDSPSIKIKI